jgi:hypothetical protein
MVDMETLTRWGSSNYLDAVYENGVLRPLEPLLLGHSAFLLRRLPQIRKGWKFKKSLPPL